MVPFDKSTTALSHYHAVGVAVTDEVVLQDGVSSPADVYAPPLVLSDDVLWKFEQCFYSEWHGKVGKTLRHGCETLTHL